MDSKENKRKCFVMICNDRTQDIAIQKGIMGTVSDRREYVEGIAKGTQGLMWNYNTKELIGIFEALEEPEDRNNEPDPWEGTGKGPYPIQFRVKIVGSELKRLPNADDIFKRAEIPTIPAHKHSRDEFIPESAVYRIEILEFFRMAYEAYQREVNKARKSAVAAIMGRNLAHNIGSGVLSYLVSEYNLPVKDRESANTLYKEINVFKEDKAMLRWFVRNNRYVLRYLQERMDFLATILTFVPSCSTMNLLDDIIGDPENPEPKDSVLNYDVDQDNDLKDLGPSYKKNRYLRPINLIYNYLVFSENLNGVNIQREKLKIKFMSRMPESINPIVALPGGIIGKQAFYVILENLIRNAAKHAPKRFPPESLQFTISISDFDQDKYRIDIADNLENGGISGILMGKCGGKIVNPVTGEHENINLGIKEIKIAAAFLRGISPEHIDTYIDNKAKEIVGFSNDNGNLMCTFFVLKPKDVLLLTKTKIGGDPYDNDALAKAGIDIMTLEDIKANNPGNRLRHRFLVYSRKEISESDLVGVQGSLPIRQISFEGYHDSLMDESTRFVGKVYEKWLRKMVRSNEPLPALAIEMTGSIPLVNSGLAIKFDEIDETTPYILYYDHFGHDKIGRIRQKNPLYRSIEEITGGNSSKGRIRADNHLELLRWELVEAGLAKLLIIDERIYNASRKDASGEILQIKNIAVWDFRSYNEQEFCLVNLNDETTANIRKTNEHPVIEFLDSLDNGKYTCISIHQGIVDKINERLNLEEYQEKGQNEQEAKKAAIKEILYALSPYADYIFVHSGRGSTEELPDGIRFINYPDLEHWFYDDKTTLVQGLFSVRGG